jgi:hypothetical protein
VHVIVSLAWDWWVKRSSVFLDRIGPQDGKSRPKIKEVGIAAHCIARGRAEGGMSSQRIRSITMTMCSTGDKVAFGDKRSVKHVRKVVSHRSISSPLEYSQHLITPGVRSSKIVDSASNRMVST